MSTVSILPTLINAGSFDILLSVIECAGLRDLYNDPGSSLTLFAPTDDAFNDLDPIFLADLLDNPLQCCNLMFYLTHDGELSSSELPFPGTILMKNLENTNLEGNPQAVIFDNNSPINTAALIFLDIEATNGVIHAIDAVIFPADLDAAKPTTTAPPDETTTAAPDQTTTAAPDQTTTAAPDQTTTAAPDQTTTAAPDQTTTAAPDQTTTFEPSTTAPPTTTSTPDETTTTPDETTTTPDDTTTAAPEPTTTAPAETTTAPAETTTAPAETTTAPAETTQPPDETTTSAPDETTTSAPDETTTAAPDETTTSEPSTTAPPTTAPPTTAPPTTTPPTTTPPTTEPVDDMVCETLKYWSLVLEGFCGKKLTCPTC